MNCSQLHAFLDGELPADEHARFEAHFVQCDDCRTAAETAMQLFSLGHRLAQRADRPVAVTPLGAEKIHRRAPRWAWAAAAAAACCALLLWLWVWPRGDGLGPVALGPRRALAERLPYDRLDVYRRYDPDRSAAVRAEAIPLDAMTQLEARRDWAALAASHIARGEIDAADAVLATAGETDEANVARAIVLERRGKHDAALEVLDRVLARTPAQPQATWNRALVVSKLGLSLVAAEAFDAAAGAARHRGDPRWAAEAAVRAADLRVAQVQNVASWTQVYKACSALVTGVVPDVDLVRRYASVFRPSFLEAVRRARSAEAVARLAPVAEALDAAAQVPGAGAAAPRAMSALVASVAKADFRIRTAAIETYAALTAPGQPQATKERMLATLQTSGQIDLVLGALSRSGMWRDHLGDYVRLAHDAADPYLVEVAEEFTAEAQQAAGEPLRAELGLREAVERCAKTDVELRCSYLYMALARLYLARHRPVEARQVALAALERSRRIGLYWDERLLFNLLADAVRLSRDHAAMRAYIREAELRYGECLQRELGQEFLAEVEIDELRFATARAELSRAPSCDEPPTLRRAHVEAELARIDGTHASIAAARDLFAVIRRDAPLTAGQLAYLSALEGRLLATEDPAASRTRVAEAIAEADGIGLEDVWAVKARNEAYKTRLIDHASTGAAADVLDDFAAAVRAAPPAGCVLAAAIDGERMIAVARDPGGRTEQVFERDAFHRPDFDPATVIPRSLVALLASCPRVDVLALPPLYGSPHLLPAATAWSYRGPAHHERTAGVATALVIEDARPPRALGLPDLPSTWQGQAGTAIKASVLRGEAATPDRVRAELPGADYVEIHAHGFVDLGISDVSLLALSPQANGSFALTARSIASLHLDRAPFVALAACQAAYTAPYLHEPWSLPYAFLLAGARGVLAPSSPIPNDEANEFFRAVGSAILVGKDPAFELRDQRTRHRGRGDEWIDGVVLFD